MEKRRRARINASLAELRSLIPDYIKRGNRRCSKMEKADILEMAVQYLRLLQGINRNKSQMNTVSYSQGFNECTREVRDFFRSSSPSASRFKGNLLDHLNNCVANNTPDSPSSSPTKAGRRSVNASFTASSIIARCLLSSTTIGTPVKMSSNVRNSNTPAAVSSTSDDCGNERVLLLEEEQCDSNLDTTSRYTRDPPQGHRSGVFRVKKDLIRSFVDDSGICQTQTGSSQMEKSNSSSKVPSSNTDVTNNCSREIFKQNTFIDGNKTETISTNISSPVESDFVANDTVKNDLSLFQTAAAPMLTETEQNNKDDNVASPSSDQVETSTYGKTEPQILEDSSTRDSYQLFPSSNIGNQSQSIVNVNNKILRLPNTVSLIENVETNVLDTTSHCLDNINCNNLQSPKSNIADNGVNSNDIQLNCNSLSLPNSPRSSQVPAESTLSLKEHPSLPPLALEPPSKSLSSKRFTEGPSVSAGIQNLISTENMTDETTSSHSGSIQSVVIPIYLQNSMDGSAASLQQAIIIKSPDKTNTFNPTLYVPDKTFRTVTPKDTTSLPANIQQPSSKYNSEKIVSTNMVSSTVNGEVALLQAEKMSPRSPSLYNANVLESHTQIHVHNKTNNSMTAVKISPESKQNLLTSKPFYHQQNAQSLQSNINGECTVTNMLSNCSTPTNLHSPVRPIKVIVTSPSLSQLQMKRPLSDIENTTEELPGHFKKVKNDNLSNSINRLLVIQTNLSQPNSVHDDLHSNSNQYSLTKFRPIAPKKDTNKAYHSDYNNLSHQHSSIQAAPITKCGFQPNSLLDNAQTNNDSVKSCHEICPNHTKFASFGGEGQHRISADSCNLKICTSEKLFTNRSTTKDDILTTALKSNLPLDKIKLASNRWNLLNQDPGEFIVEQNVSSSSIYKCQTDNNHTSNDIKINHMTSVNIPNQITSDNNNLTERNPQNLTNMVECHQEDRLVSGPNDIHDIIKCNNLPNIIGPVKMLLNSPNKQVSTRNSVTYSLETANYFHETDNFQCNEQNSISQTAMSSDHHLGPYKHHILTPSLGDIKKNPGQFLMKSNERETVSTPQQNTGKCLTPLRNVEYEEMKNELELCNSLSGITRVMSSYPVSISPQPLNLSLRGANGQERKPFIQDTRPVEDECFQKFDLKFKKHSNGAASTQDWYESPSTISSHNISGDYMKTVTLFNKKLPQQRNGIIKAIDKDSLIIDPSLHSIGAATFKDTNYVSLNTDTIRYRPVYIKPGCRILLASCNERDVTHLQGLPDVRVSPSCMSDHEIETNPQLPINILSSMTSVTSSPTTANHVKRLEIPSQSKNVPILSALSHTVLKVSDQLEMGDDDVWRPW